MVKVLRARNDSPRTIQAYISAVARFARHFVKSPDQFGTAHVTEFQLWFREPQKILASSFHQIILRPTVLYGEVLDRWDVSRANEIRVAARFRRPSCRELAQSLRSENFQAFKCIELIELT